MPDSTPKDLLTWKAGTLAAILLAGPVIAGRIHAAKVAPVTALVAVVLAAFLVTRLEAKRRMRVGTLVAIVGCYHVAIIWPWGGIAVRPFDPATFVASGLALAPPVLLGPFLIWCVGSRSKSKANAAALVKRGLRMVDEGLRTIAETELPPGAKLRPAAVGRNNTAVLKGLHLEASNPRGEGLAHVVSRFANRLGLTTKQIKGIDLSATKAAGEAELEFPLVQPFVCQAPPKPAATPQGIPLGWDAHGNPYVLDIASDDAQHLLVFGASGAGKSNFLRGLIQDWKLGAGAEVWACDPKGGQGLRASRWADRWSVKDEEAATMLRDAVLEMERREAAVGEGNQYDGSWLVVVVDECDSVMNKITAISVKMLVKRGRSSKVVLVMGLQAQRVTGVGGGDVLANFVTRIGFRTTSDLEDRMGFSTKNEPGHETHLIDRAHKGRFVAKGLPTHDRINLQAWPAPDLPAGLSVPSTPPTGEAPHAGETPPDTPRTDTPRTDTPDSQTPQYDDRIADMLTHVPTSARGMADYVKCSPDTAAKALKRLAAQGRAHSTSKGWVAPEFANEEAA